VILSRALLLQVGPYHQRLARSDTYSLKAFPLARTLRPEAIVLEFPNSKRNFYLAPETRCKNCWFGNLSIPEWILLQHLILVQARADRLTRSG